MNATTDHASSAVRERVSAAVDWLGSRIIGQDALVERIVMALLTGGHLLVEGAPGLAKTRAIKELANTLEGDFHRVQFTPDLLPSDITGTEIYRPETGEFQFQPGPIFHNLLLADEVNRAPAKVQAALLEAMAERQVSIGRETYALPALFLVMATQNPIEQEGTYPLPEAQLDRFLLHVEVAYPSAAAELEILRLVRAEAETPLVASQPPVRLTQSDVFAARAEIFATYMAPAVEQYIVQLILATRDPRGPLADVLEFGASPRASIALDQCARTLAWLAGREFVTPEDVRRIAPDVLRHRLIMTFDAQAQGNGANAAIEALLGQVPVP
ncbi:MAG: MoxR family ATPase [Pseudomonadota bacterium]